MLKALFWLGIGLLVGNATKRSHVDQEFVRPILQESNINNMFKPVVMCVKHPGYGLLPWSNGEYWCFECGMERFRT